MLSLRGVLWNTMLGYVFFLLRKVGDHRLPFHSSFSVGSRCQRGDSNPHGLLHWILSPARLPIPPLRRSRPKDSDRLRLHQSGDRWLKKKESPRQPRGGFLEPGTVWSTCPPADSRFSARAF